MVHLLHLLLLHQEEEGKPHSAGGAADFAANVAEGVVGVGAQGRDGRDAHHDDEGQHDGVLDRGRAIFVLQEANQVLRELAHGTRTFLCSVPRCVAPPLPSGRGGKNSLSWRRRRFCRQRS